MMNYGRFGVPQLGVRSEKQKLKEKKVRRHRWTKFMKSHRTAFSSWSCIHISSVSGSSGAVSGSSVDWHVCRQGPS